MNPIRRISHVFSAMGAPLVRSLSYNDVPTWFCAKLEICENACLDRSKNVAWEYSTSVLVLPYC